MTRQNDHSNASDGTIAPLPPEPRESAAPGEDPTANGEAFDGVGDEHLAPLPPRVERSNADPGAVAAAIDRYLAIQRPIVLFQIRQLRKRHPDATPTELSRMIELQYLNTVTATGGGAGAAAVVPGIGTVASIAVTGAETVGFLEMTALYGQAIAEIHGVAVSDPVRARTLVQSLMLGDAAQQIIRQFTGEVTGKGGSSRQQFWGEMVVRNLPKAAVGELSQRIRKAFMARFAARTAGGTLGRLIPFGVGAIVGGFGNRLLARAVVRSAHEAFGPAPSVFPLDLHPDAVTRGEAPKKALPRGRGLFFLLPRKATMPELEAGSRDD